MLVRIPQDGNVSCLEALPEELVSRICRFLGHRIGAQEGDLQHPDGEVWYDNIDFVALPGTCRTIYAKTE